MRLNDKFSKLYTLVRECVKDIFLFLFYFAFWIVFYSTLYNVTGAAFDESGDAQTTPTSRNKPGGDGTASEPPMTPQA